MLVCLRTSIKKKDGKNHVACRMAEEVSADYLFELFRLNRQRTPLSTEVDGVPLQHALTRTPLTILQFPCPTTTLEIYCLAFTLLILI